MKDNPILSAALSVAADHYNVRKEELCYPLDKAFSDRLIDERNKKVMLARGAYLHIATTYNITSLSAADYIGLNAGNATTYRQRFQSQMKPSEQLSLFDKVGKRIQLKTK